MRVRRVEMGRRKRRMTFLEGRSVASGDEVDWEVFVDIGWN